MKASMQLVIPVIFGFCGLMLSSCGGKSQETENKEENKLRSGLVVINVLDKKLFDDCHIKGSINIPVEEIAKSEQSIDKNAEIVLYCSNYLCSSSEYAARKLKALGFANVAVYSGGTAEWFQKGLPVEGPHQSAYLTKANEPVEMQEEGINVVTVDELAGKMGIEIAAANAQIAQTSEVQSA